MFTTFIVSICFFVNVFQELKESQLNEYAKLIKAVEDERLKLLEQKAQIEVSKQLQNRNSGETGISRAEIDAAVRYAEVNVMILLVHSKMILIN